MTQSKNQAPAAKNAESGFTLVELAIVMIIIGLLIGGILKGQELINNARVSSTVAQAKAVESGISGFRDKYASMPGDTLTPNTRIPSCSDLCAVAGDGNGLVQPTTANNPGAVSTAANSEAKTSFVQLSAAGFIGGVQSNAPAAVAAAPGVSVPTTPLGGAWQFGYSDGGTTAVTGLVAANTGAGFAIPSGHYIVSVLTPGTNAAGNAANMFMTPVQAAAIDRKLDDGTPNGGTVRALGAAGAATCVDAATNIGVYNEAIGAANCGVLIKVQ